VLACAIQPQNLEILVLGHQFTLWTKAIRSARRGVSDQATAADRVGARKSAVGAELRICRSATGT
jgi:hypothetical protein